MALVLAERRFRLLSNVYEYIAALRRVAVAIHVQMKQCNFGPGITQGDSRLSEKAFKLLSENY